MKKLIALAMTLVLLTAMFPTVFAAQEQPGAQIQTAELLDVVTENYEAPEVGEKMNYYVPTFDMYGMTVVKGDPMTLSGVVYNGDRYNVKVGVMIYEGTYEEIAEDSQPVASSLRPTIYSNSYTERFYWDTTGMKTGDYTAIMFLTDAKDTVLYASVCDLYIADKEIPLERLGIYVMELGMETDQVRLPADSHESMSLAVVRYPYHTTDRREALISGTEGNFSYGMPNFPVGEGITAPRDPGNYLIKAWLRDEGLNAEFTTELEVIVEEDVGQFPVITALDGGIMCFGQVKRFQIDFPEGTDMNDALIHVTLDGLVEVTRVEGNVIYLKGIRTISSWQYLIAAVGNRFVTWNFESRNHDDYTWYEKEPTCTESGVRGHSCGWCYMKWYEDVPAKGHRIKDGAEIIVIEEPKATKPGISGGECERCGELATFETIHIFYDTEPDWFYSDALDHCYEMAGYSCVLGDWGHASTS